MLRQTGNTVVGTAEAGFRLACAPTGNEIRIETWGYWPSELALDFGRQAVAACRTLSSPLHLVFDAACLKPQSRDGQESFRAVMRCVALFSLSGATIVTGNALTKMQLLRLIKECGLDSVVQFEDSSVDSR